MTSQSDVLQQALEWQVTFWSGMVTDDERSAFQRWLNADSRHAVVWGQIQATDSKLAMMSAPGATPALRAARQSASRRKSLRAFGMCIGAGLVMLAVRETPQWQVVMADYRTGRGERRQVMLPDGTLVILNTATAVDVVFDARLRLLHLRSGEIFVATAPDPAAAGRPARPFIVETAQGKVRPIGTRFTVRQDEGRSQVAVLEGAVEISPRHAADAGRLLKAGQETSFNAHEVTPCDAILTATAAAWTHGVMVAERLRLQDFLAELSRYRSGFLRCDPAVADLLVSGVFSIDDTDAALASLVDALPVRLLYLSRFWVNVYASE
jgi:transmembrane sensor